MMAQKKKAEDKQLSVRVKARPVPGVVKKNKYEMMLQEEEDRRADAKRLSIAKTKANEAPFAFHERDVLAQKERQ
jgi:hypothetical protein